MGKWMKCHPVMTVVIGYFTVLTVLAGFAFYWLFIDMQHLPTEERLLSSRSPDGEYTLTVYRNNGGATVPYTLSGEVTAARTGKQTIIYWADGVEAEVEWSGETNVRINGVELDVRSEKYDYRRHRQEGTDPH
ncbi:DUF5412 family protein [Sporosarcina trichiuri]|uniref:DUF5412 family protein n=1 Tax=Sporosarcina trichiuri TaxID=3056445 RepID=UPI0025B3F11E|nr:DUF5412 family protein [Sporosarcina sp. 0.2-SM1T-5]WJY28134.1 DUF5412 family protein [Sporosarcina sp. 0.2-SM1T-5]